MDIKATAMLKSGDKIVGRLVSDEAGVPAFVKGDAVIDWRLINSISTAPEIGAKGGSVKSKKKSASSRENGKKGGRPRKAPKQGSVAAAS